MFDWKAAGKGALRAFLRLATSAPLLVALVLALAIHFGAALVESLAPGPEYVVVHYEKRLERAQEAPEASKWPQATLPCPEAGIPVLRPPGDEREAVAEEFGRPDLLEPSTQEPRDSPTPFAPNQDTLIYNREIVGLLLVPKMPEGGKALVSYETSTGSFDVDWVINPWTETAPAEKAKKRFEFPKQWGFGGYFEQNDLDGEWEWSGVDDWDVYAFIEPLRIGRVTWRVQGGVRSFMDENPKYLRFGFEYRRK